MAWATEAEKQARFHATTFGPDDTVCCWVCDAEYPASRGIFDENGILVGTTCGCDDIADYSNLPPWAV